VLAPLPELTNYVAMKPIVLYLGYFILFYLLVVVAAAISRFNKHRRFVRQLKRLESQLTRLNISQVQKKCSALDQQALDLFASVDAMRARKPSI
jgi:hypothetical protein